MAIVEGKFPHKISYTKESINAMSKNELIEYLEDAKGVLIASKLHVLSLAGVAALSDALFVSNIVECISKNVDFFRSDRLYIFNIALVLLTTAMYGLFDEAYKDDKETYLSLQNDIHDILK